MGGGLYNTASSTATMITTDWLANFAVLGGAIHNQGIIDVSNSRLLANQASDSGSALYQTNASANSHVTQSCIATNDDVAVVNDDGDPTTASFNWWGAPDGPSGEGPGSGDSVSTNVTFSNFQTTPILGCPFVDGQVGLTVSKVANVSQAVAGDTITYTYQITNTGNVTLTITANDNPLGTVAGLAGELAPLATRTATLSYVVQESDPIGPLVNTVTVTGTMEGGAPLVVTATATVDIGSPTSLPEEEQPTQRREMYLPKVGQ